MDFTSRDAANVRFRGTRFAYDRVEVDRFHRQVVAALEGYEAALEEVNTKLERLARAGRTRLRTGDRAAQALPSSRPAPAESVESTEIPPARAPTSDPLASFHRWRAEFATRLETEAVLRAAREEAAMVRGSAVARAADEIDRLTAAARSEARAVTKRAALLAAETEEAARHRAREILGGSGSSDGRRPADEAEMELLTERIGRLRSSIADVQGRLEALASSEAATGGADDEVEIVEIDLRDAMGEVARSPQRAQRRQKITSMANAETTTDALEAKVAELKRRLSTD